MVVVIYAPILQDFGYIEVVPEGIGLKVHADSIRLNLKEFER